MLKRTQNRFFYAIRKHFDLLTCWFDLWEMHTSGRANPASTKDMGINAQPVTYFLSFFLFFFFFLSQYTHSLGSSACQRLFNVPLLLRGSEAFSVHPFHGDWAIRGLYTFETTRVSHGRLSGWASPSQTDSTNRLCSPHRHRVPLRTVNLECTWDSLVSTSIHPFSIPFPEAGEPGENTGRTCKCCIYYIWINKTHHLLAFYIVNILLGCEYCVTLFYGILILSISQLKGLAGSQR